MLADAHDVPMTQTDLAGNDTNVSVIVEMLRVRKGVTKAEMALGSGVPLRTISRRINGAGHWEWRELKALAAYFDISMSAFDSDPEAIFAPPTIPRYWGDSAMPIASLPIAS